MSTIEDKILDGPRIHYCDAGNDDIRHEENDGDEQPNAGAENNVEHLLIRPDDETERLNRASQVKWRGYSTNTGPKGVIEDYKKRVQKERAKQKPDEVDELEAEFQELLNDDSVLKEYIAKRISNLTSSPTFGQVYRLKTGSELLDAIDKENDNVLIIVHIYTKYSRACSQLNRCLDELAADLKHMKFITLDASVTNLSTNFKENGVPALLAYKKGDLVKSLVQLEELLDRDFDSGQVKELLIDNGMLA